MEVSKFAQVKEDKTLIRDLNSKAILNKDDGGLNKYKEDREFKFKIAKVMQEHDDMKNDVTEIKQMLRTILGKI
jgi:hypothetical protein